MGYTQAAMKLVYRMYDSNLARSAMAPDTMVHAVAQNCTDPGTRLSVIWESAVTLSLRINGVLSIAGMQTVQMWKQPLHAVFEMCGKGTWLWLTALLCNRMLA